jgi:hypothetical protein
MRLRLTRKLADEIDGVNLHDHDVGDVLELPQTESYLLLAEKWALPERRWPNDTSKSPYHRRAEDRPTDAMDETYGPSRE